MEGALGLHFCAVSDYVSSQILQEVLKPYLNLPT